MRKTTEELIESLELLVDENGLTNTLYALSHMCAEKEERIRVYCDNPALAKIWQKASKSIFAVANKVGFSIGRKEALFLDRQSPREKTTS